MIRVIKIDTSVGTIMLLHLSICEKIVLRYIFTCIITNKKYP